MAGSRIKGITVTIGGDTTGLEKALKSVNTAIKTTQTQLKDVEHLLKLDPKNTELLAQKQEKLKESISATKEKQKALKNVQEQAKAQMEAGDLGKDKYDALQREIIETEQEIERLAKQAAESNTALTKIGEAGQTLENVGNKMADVGSSLMRNVTMPIAAIGPAAVKTTADFDEQMSKISASSGATGKEYFALRDKAREMGSKTKFSASEAGEVFEYKAMAGWFAIINSSDQDFAKLTEAFDGCDGAPAAMAVTMQNNLSGQITILKSSLQELMIQTGDALRPTVRKIVEKVQDFALKLQKMDDGRGE